MEKRLILVEDDLSLGYLLSEYLTMKDFKVVWVKLGEECLRKLHSHHFDLAILDVMLPDIDGFSLARTINQLHPELPFIFLTARGLKIDVLKGFSVGAVDYLKKPIDEEELVVRINTLLHRLRPSALDIEGNKDLYFLGQYTLHRALRELVFQEETQKLTQRENELLAYLVEHKNRLCSHRDILIRIWGGNDYFNRKSLNVFITRLRKYLVKDSKVKIENVHGEGFILKIGD